ncbi:MAG TPA: hypothetical protein PKJ08_04050 [Candidatus Cloacimonadota bacterium]|jgi:hypothetical protein|nr:hypothetical protein [Candidatus Cloacimonadota bacterium]HOD53677.1 hypothetical protein [Candidatus Cloacimonadota bacterium]HPM00670.1 hypothetical protein [Candidatus Cloacimonadota bacterium]
MAISNVQSHLSNTSNIYQKYTELYKSNNPTKQQVIPENQPNTQILEIRDISSSELKDFLSNDEKKVLKEVFGDLSVDKQTIPYYNSLKSTELLKGSQIDIKL